MRYGFWGGVDWQMGTMPADFLIGPDGRIVRAHYGRNFGDHLTVVEIEAALSELAFPNQELGDGQSGDRVKGYGVDKLKY
jgi:hypothetical protein